ncbi:MAG: tyrosine-type recombinase/integrase [Proteobacteria bacterium]|nr:tyrosine-type recombinase/integrase [Pseudomonadota bacterium]
MHSPETLGRQITFFFTDYLVGQRGASPHTVHSYRDTFKLLLGFAACRASKKVADLSLADLDAPTVLAFLEHIEGERKCSIATRNVRLAAIRTFFRIVAANVPTAFEQCQRVIVIPMKIAPRRPIDYLERNELEAVLAAIDRSKSGGLRDYALFALIYNCGNRVQETLNLNANDLHLFKPFFVRLRGKGNKERVSPLWPQTAVVLRDLLARRGVEPTSTAPIFVNQRGERLGRDGVAYLLQKYVEKAGVRVSSLGRKRVHPHSLRHTTAVHMRRAGDEPNAIAALLGHAQITTTERFYGHVDLEEKRKAIEANPPPIKPTRGRWRRPEVLEFLTSL